MEDGGRSLFDLGDIRGLEGFPSVTEVIWRILQGVVIMHQNGVAHCDVKPENILIGCGGRVSLIDFDSALSSGAFHRSIVTTVTVQAPEQILGCGWDERVDVFSVGCVWLEELLGGFEHQYERGHVLRVIRLGGANRAKHVWKIESLLGKLPAWMWESATREVDYSTLGSEFKERVEALGTLESWLGRRATLDPLLSAHLSEGVLELLVAMLKPDPEERISSSDALAALERLVERKG
jgi:serine/threonine protein kinase